MARRVTLKGINRTRRKLADRRVRIIHYVGRGRGAVPIWTRTIPADPADSPYDEGSPEYLAAIKETVSPAPAKRPKRSFGDCLDRFIDSPEFSALADRTRKDYRKYLEAAREEFGVDDPAIFDDARIREDVNTWRNKRYKNPRDQKYAMQVMSILINWMYNCAMLKHHQLRRMKSAYKANRSDLIWTPAIQAQFLERATQDGRPDLARALRFGCAFGFRVSDAVRCGRQNVIEREGLRFLAPRTAKRDRVAVPMITGEGAAVVDDTPPGQMLFLVQIDGTPWESGGQLSRDFSALARAAGIEKLTYEDTRGTAATNRYIAGESIEDIAPAMGWAPQHAVAVIENYVKFCPKIAVERRIRQLKKNSA